MQSYDSIKGYGSEKEGSRFQECCCNNWIRRTAGVKIVERRRMKDLREEIGESDETGWTYDRNERREITEKS